MGKQYKELSENDIKFIEKQKLFFIASASTAEVNLSPRGYDCVRVEDACTIHMLDLPGSGNRTARDSQNNGKFTLLFTAFDGKPNLLRLFCSAEIMKEGEEGFSQIFEKFDMPQDITRQIFKFTINAVESSCGMSVPIMNYEQNRDALKDWAIDKANKGDLTAYIDKHEIPPVL